MATRYSAQDIERIRAAVRIIADGARRADCGARQSDRILGDLANAQIVEERVRTAIAGGVTPEEAESLADAEAIRVIRYLLKAGGNPAFTAHAEWAQARRLEFDV